MLASKFDDRVTDTNRSACTATGGSAVKAVECLLDHGVPQSRIIFLNLVASPEGIRHMADLFPEIKIISAWGTSCAARLAQCQALTRFWPSLLVQWTRA